MEPADLSIMVDAETGKVLQAWNNLHIHGDQDPQAAQSEVPQSLTVNEGVDVNRPVGGTPVEVNIPVSEDVTIESALLKLGTPNDPGIAHDWRGDVVINVTSPSGRNFEFAPFDANDSTDDVSGTFDLSEVFAGESSRGNWTVEISDRFPAADDGVVRRLELEFDGPQASPTPVPIPTPGPDPVRDDFSEFIGNVDLDTTEVNGGFVLRTEDGRVETRDARGQNDQTIAGRFDLTTPFFDNDDTWGGANAPKATKAAVETHHAATTFLDFLDGQFGLDSLDNRGMKIEAIANVGVDYNNAFWFDDTIHIGNGDDRVFSRLSTIDIVGHELAHGVTQKSADLIYAEQSGGLNESYSDIIGTAFEWWQTKQPGAEENGTLPFDWRVGEDSFTPGNGTGDALRYMNDPTRDGVSLDHASQYDPGNPPFTEATEVHRSSGIQNNAFYLAVEGGTHRLGGEVDGLRSVFDGDF
ncbi:MAG: M4 family metallopeptidase, partial [Myxococcota bacterium]